MVMERSRVWVPCLLSVQRIPLEVRARPEELIFVLSFMTAVSLMQLAYEDIDGNPVPTIIFKAQPSTFHAFLISLCFAFTGAVCTLMLREDYPKLARYSRRLGVVSILVTVAVVMWVAVPAGFRWVAQLTC